MGAGIPNLTLFPSAGGAFCRRCWSMLGESGVAGLLPLNPGRRSLRLACPGLYYVAPFGRQGYEGRESRDYITCAG